MSNEMKARDAQLGLATIAFLKARFDAGMDYLDMLKPFVEEAIVSMGQEDIDLLGMVNEVESAAGLQIPAETVKTLLQRAARSGLLERRGGRYFRTQVPTDKEPLSQKLKDIYVAHESLATELRDFAGKRGQTIASNADALAVLVEFLDVNQICFVLGQELEAYSRPRDVKLDQVLAAFVTLTTRRRDRLYYVLDDVVKGLVVQNALLSRHIPRKREFEGMTVFLDTGVLLRALGLAGHTELNAAIESLNMIRKAGAKLRVFEKTIDEVTSIMSLYEERLRTSAGAKSLRPTAVTAHLLRIAATPADIRQEIALLRTNITSLRASIEEFPSHVAEYTEDERALADRLSDPGRPWAGGDSRVWHDVGAVAAILTLRANRRPSRLQNARYLFVSESRQTIANVQQWYRERHPDGFEPIVNLRLIANAAWMLNPGASPQVPMHQLVTACTAMLLPDERVWASFVERLEQLVTLGEVSDDETIAVLASEFTWERVAEVDPDDDLEANSVKEIVERAQQQWRAEFQTELGSAVDGRNAADMVAAEKTLYAQRVESSVEDAVTSWCRRLCWILFIGLVAVAIIGATLTLPTAWSEGLRKDDFGSGLWWICVSLFVVWSISGIIFKGLYVHELVERTSSWISRRVLRALLPN